MGIFQQLSRFVFRRGNSSARHKRSIRRVHGGVGVKSSRKGVFIGDMCDGMGQARLWFRRQGKGEGSINSQLVALVRETADLPVYATIGSAQIRVNSQRHRLAPTEEDIFMTPTGRRSWTTIVFIGRLGEEAVHVADRTSDPAWTPM